MFQITLSSAIDLLCCFSGYMYTRAHTLCFALSLYGQGTQFFFTKRKIGHIQLSQFHLPGNQLHKTDFQVNLSTKFFKCGVRKLFFGNAFSLRLYHTFWERLQDIGLS